MRPGQASKDERAAAQGERTAQNHAPGAAIIAPTLEACPWRNYEPISILKTGIFLTFCPLSNASKMGTAQTKVYGTFKQTLKINSSESVCKHNTAWRDVRPLRMMLCHYDSRHTKMCVGWLKAST